MAAAEESDDAALKENLKRLLRDELFASAEILGSLLLQRPAATSSADGGEVLALRHAGAECFLGARRGAAPRYADALYGKGEFKRAQGHYRKAQQRLRVAQGPARTGGYGAEAPSESDAEAELKFKEARCCVALDEVPGRRGTQ